MSGSSLDLTALDGVVLNADQYAFANPSEVSTGRTGGSYTVTGGEDPAAASSAGNSVNSALPLEVTVSQSNGEYWIAFKQSGNGTLYPIGESNAYVIAGWNADGVLLKAVQADLPQQWQYLIVSDQALSSGLTTAGGSNVCTNTSTAAPDLGGVQLTVTCFAAGTRIATPSGTVAVEDLAEGDFVCTLSGTAQPITWIGQRHFDCAAHPQPGRVAPVRVVSGAFGPGLPVRDLFLSPEHALFLDGVLVPVQHLVNGRSIRQVAASDVTYYHLELPRHDVVLAEGLAAETYLDTGSRDALIRREAAIAQAA